MIRQHDTQSEDVCAHIRRFMFQLLGRHVLERSDDGLLLGEVPLLGWCIGGAGLRLSRQDLGQAKIQELDPRLRQHGVAGFQVTMDDAGSVRGFQSVGDLNPIFQSLIERERSFLQPLRERVSLDVLHDEVIDAVLLADVIKGADVRMIQLRDRFGLTLEARLALGAICEVLEKNFDRHRPVEPSVLGFENLAHTSLANWREDFVGA